MPSGCIFKIGNLPTAYHSQWHKQDVVLYTVEDPDYEFNILVFTDLDAYRARIYGGILDNSDRIIRGNTHVWDW